MRSSDSHPGVPLIGLSGYPRAGKDTAASLMETGEVWAYPVRTIAFANPMRRIAECFWGDVARYRAHNEGGYREALQSLGAMVRKEWGEHFWVDLAAKKYRDLRATVRGVIVVVSDVRYPNELGWIRDMGGELWWVDNPKARAVNSHESEQHYEYLRENADYIIENPGTLSGLTSAIRHRVRRAPAQRHEDPLSRPC